MADIGLVLSRELACVGLHSLPRHPDCVLPVVVLNKAYSIADSANQSATAILTQSYQLEERLPECGPIVFLQDGEYAQRALSGMEKITGQLVLLTSPRSSHKAKTRSP